MLPPGLVLVEAEELDGEADDEEEDEDGSLWAVESSASVVELLAPIPGKIGVSSTRI